MTQFTEVIRGGGGWCPNNPVRRTLPAVLPVLPANLQVRGGSPAGSGVGGSGRFRDGIVIALESIRTLFRERHLLWFSFFAGIVMLVMVAGQALIILNSAHATPFLVSLPPGTELVLGDIRIFLLQLICLSCFVVIFAALVQNRSRGSSAKSLTVSEVFSAIRPYAVSLAGLSLIPSFVGTVLFAIITHSRIFGKIGAGISTTLFYLPYAYYFPDLFDSALWFSAILLVLAIVEFLTVLYVVPSIILERRGLVQAFCQSLICIKRTWHEMLGCILVFGGIVLGVVLVALVIGQSPQLLDHDYDFFLQITRGKILMMAACYGFVFACGALAAAGSTVMGIAITDLYSVGTAGRAAPYEGSAFARR